MSFNFDIPVFGLTELGKKISMGTIHRVRADAMAIGGTIFYIDPDDNGAIYHFYDSEGDEIPIQNIVPGYTGAVAYSIEGTPTKDKYYFFNNQLLTSKVWSYQQDGRWVYNLLGTKTGIGEGRNNTNIVMTADSGKYIAQTNSIWHFLDIANNIDKPGGHSDWFIPSKDEVEKLRLAVDAEGNPLVTWFTNNYIWSSSENSAQNSWYWSYTSQYWTNCNKSNALGVFFVRAS